MTFPALQAITESLDELDAKGHHTGAGADCPTCNAIVAISDAAYALARELEALRLADEETERT